MTWEASYYAFLPNEFSAMSLMRTLFTLSYRFQKISSCEWIRTKYQSPKERSVNDLLDDRKSQDREQKVD